MAMIPSARSSALVGAPNWSLTTEMFVALARQREHGPRKIASERTVDPAGAQNDVVAVGGGNGAFAPELAVAINAERVGRIILAIGAIKLAIKHIVGRKLNDGNSEPFGRTRGGFRAQGIDPVGEIGFAFGAIDRGVGGGVDDGVGRKIDQGALEFRRAHEVNVRARRGVNVDIQRRRAFKQRLRNLTMAARYNEYA